MNLRMLTLSGAAALTGFLALLASPPCLAEAPAMPEKVLTMEGITQYRLANGLKVLLFRDESTPTVTVNLTVLVGSRHEGYGETGMAHLLEHMLFKGTPTFANVPKILKEHGASYNGTTWVDRTNYFETMPGTDENLEFGIRLESDRLVHSYVKREDLLSEMTVVRSEFEMGENNPDNILSQRMLAVAYEWHNYGKSTIGNRSDIERVPIDRLQAFYRKYYQPDNAMLVVAGHFDEQKALTYLGKYFGVLKKPARRLEDTYTDEPPQDGERNVTLRRVGKVGRVGVVYHIPAAAQEDYPAMQVLNQVLVSEPSGRLYKALVEGKKASSVSGVAYAWHDPAVLEIFVQVDPMQMDEVRNTLIDTLENPPAPPFTKEEVDRAKRQLLKHRELLMTRSKDVAFDLCEWEAKGDWRLFFLHRDRLDKVTTEDVTRVAGRYLVRGNRTLGMYIPSERPERAVVPATPSVPDLLKDYKGGEVIAAGEAFDPTPENIEKRVKRTELPGGVKLALLPKKTRGEAVTLEVSLHYGNEDSLKGHLGATQFLATLMSRGTKKHTRQQIQDELDRLKASLGASGSVGNLSFTVQAKRENLPAVLQLVGEILREPIFPENEFDVLKRESKDALSKGLTEPTVLAFREVQRKLSPYPPEDVRYVPSLEESIALLEAVTVEELRKLYADQVSSQDCEVAIVGDFDPETASKALGGFLSDWKAPVAYKRIARPAQTDVAGSRKEILTPDKANAVYAAGEMLALTDADPDFPALEVGNFILGGGTLSSRLGNRVRIKEGLSYGVRSVFSADAKDKSARFMIYAICNPINIDKVDKAINEEVEKLLKEGITDDEVAEAKKSYLEAQKVQRANDGTLVSVLAEELFNNRTFNYYADLEKKVAGLSKEDVMAAVRKHFEPGKLVVVEAGDFHKKK